MELVRAVKTNQKSKDSIVARALKLAGLPSNEGRLNALYYIGKSIDLLAVATSQFALNAVSRGSARSDQDTLRALKRQGERTWHP